MSDHAIWQALHLLHVHGRPDDRGRPALPLPTQQAAGIDCHGDALYPLLQAGVIVRRLCRRRAAAVAALA